MPTAPVARRRRGPAPTEYREGGRVATSARLRACARSPRVSALALPCRRPCFLLSRARTNPAPCKTSLAPPPIALLPAVALPRLLVMPRTRAAGAPRVPGRVRVPLRLQAALRPLRRGHGRRGADAFRALVPRLPPRRRAPAAAGGSSRQAVRTSPREESTSKMEIKDRDVTRAA